MTIASKQSRPADIIGTPEILALSATPLDPVVVMTQRLDPLRVPEAGMLGLGREFAELYASYLEPPRAFFYFAFLSYFGALVAKMITLDSELRPQPRLYVVVLGDSADARKSTALTKTDELFRTVGSGGFLSVLFGVGSAEGLAGEMTGGDGPTKPLLLFFDELKAFVDKAKIDQSVLLPMVNTLFDSNTWDNKTKWGNLRVRDGYLSLVAASTLETYATMWDTQFLAIGFLNRLWLVSDRSAASIAIPEAIPPARLAELQGRVKERLTAIEEAYQANRSRPVPYPLTAEARARFEHWYTTRERSIFARRLDTYGHRLMLLLAATSGKTVVDDEVVTAVTALLDYQLEVRRACDPVDAENTVARTEERIRRVLARGPLKLSQLKRECHYNRVGLWVFNAALSNLTKAGEVVDDLTRGTVALMPRA